MEESFELMPHVNFITLSWSVKPLVGYMRVECRFYITKIKVHIR